MKNTLTLLNSEGAILKASKYYLDSMSEYRFTIYDQHKQSIADLTLEGFNEFINGEITLRDSKNSEYHYPSFPQDMKPTWNEIQLFKEKSNTLNVKIDLLRHLSFWHNKTDDECIKLATNENGLDAEQALINMIERDFALEFNKEVIEGLKNII